MGTNVQCAGCRRVLNVPQSMAEFSCPKCHLRQTVRPQPRPPPPPGPPPMRPPSGPPAVPGGGVYGIDQSKLQLPCSGCRAVLNVPPGLYRFQCPQCRAELQVDPTGLDGYMQALQRLAQESAESASLGVSTSEILKRKLRELGEALTHGGIVKKLNTGTVPPEEINEVALEVEAEEDEEGAAGETFTDYRPFRTTIGPPHPDPVVETASLSAIQPPEARYDLVAEEDILASKSLSCLQLETIIYACQRHDQHLPDGSRAGFFIGDGAGVGKGRTVAGLILENWRNGRRKALWVSIGADLKFDAKRDLDDVGCEEAEVHALNKLPYGKLDSKAIGIKEGVVFLTYSSLIAASEKGRSRLQQLVQWCGSDYDGLIVYDECHKAKNLIPEAGGQGTRTGEAVLELQMKLPQARVVYCSATGASEPRNLGYMTRLGLWGTGTDFPDFLSFLGALEKRGVGALELIAMDMKARGMYVCRTLSFKGAEFEIVQVELEPDMDEMYSKAAQFWCELRVELLQALQAMPVPTDGQQNSQQNYQQKKSQQNSQQSSQQKKSQQNSLWRFFWATHQRFFRHMCMAAKVPAAVQRAKAALAEGKCVVIGLQSTGESRTEEAVSRYGAEMDDFISGPRELLLKLVEDHFPLPPQPELEPVKKEDSPKSSVEPATASVSQRGRVRRVVRYQGYVEDDDDDYEPESESEEQDDDDMEFKLCKACGVEDDDESLLLCKSCGKAIHLGCHIPPLDEKPEGDYTCTDCGQTTAEIQAEQQAHRQELIYRYQMFSERKEELLRVIRSFNLPNNPLDDLIDQLGGPEAVAEMTGRKGMLVRAANGKGVQYQSRNSKEVSQEMVNMHEKQLFMEGAKLVAVISEAASAGISLQADRRVKNQRRRLHLTLELPWSADKAIQQFGRTHRSNQASAPQYRLLFTNLGGEKRFASVVAKRLESLGALTQGDRRAGPSLSEYNYDSVWGKKALSTAYKAIMEQARPLVLPSSLKLPDDERQFYVLARAALVSVGIIKDALPIPDGGSNGYHGRPSGKIVDSDMHDVGRFLNRALGLKPEEQNSLFDFFVAQFDALVKSARKEGNFDQGIVDIKATRIEIQEDGTVVHVDPMSGAPTTHSVAEIDRGLPWEEAKAFLENASASTGSELSNQDQEPTEEDKGSGSGNGFYRSRREWLGRRHYLLAIERTRSSPRAFRVFRPSSGEAVREMPLTELRSKYSRVQSLEEAEAGWSEDFKTSGDQCMHGPKCKVGSDCTVGRRVQQMHILGGLVFPIWGTVEQALTKQERLTHRRLRVVRLESSSDGRRIVGIHVPNPAVATVLTGLEKLTRQDQQQQF